MAFLSVQFSGKHPKYEEIAKQIETMVLNGELCADTKLPSVRELANELAINPNTIQKSYAELEQRGIIYSIGGKGSFITKNVTKLRRNKLNELSQKLSLQMQNYQKLGGQKPDILTMIDAIYTKGERQG